MATDTMGSNMPSDKSYVKMGFDTMKIGGTLCQAWKSLTSWRCCFDSYEELKIQLSKILKAVQSSKSVGKPPRLTSKACSDLRECCSKAASYSKDYFQFDLQCEVTEAVGDGINSIDKEKLEKLLSKLTASMTKQLEQMLWGELVKTVAQTAQTIGELVKTYFIIRESEQYRKSPTLQQATVRINENLEKARNFYQNATNEIDRIENTPNVHPTQYILGQIGLNLDRARLESDCARREIETIMRDIAQNLRRLSSERTSHAVNIGQSLLNTGVTIVQWTYTPLFLLSTTAKALFVANGGLQAANVIGHSIGFYWSNEEIQKMEKIQDEMKALEATMEDSFKKIQYGAEKLESLKRRMEVAADLTLVDQE